MTPAPAAVNVDIVAQSALWRRHKAARRIIGRAIAAAVMAIPRDGETEVAVALIDDAAMRALNRDWRGQDAPTNVLSFPAAAPERGSLGDIALACETIEREAEAEGKPFAHHLAHLAVHGTLHLLGFDHETEAEAERMEAAERAILARLRIPDPYRGSDAARPARASP